MSVKIQYQTKTWKPHYVSKFVNNTSYFIYNNTDEFNFTKARPVHLLKSTFRHGRFPWTLIVFLRRLSCNFHITYRQLFAALILHSNSYKEHQYKTYF